MYLLRSLLNFVTPDSCLGCNQEGVVVCADCQSRLYYREQCIGCQRQSTGGLTCSKCKSRTSISALYAVSSYDGLAKDAVTYMKYHPSSSAAEVAGDLLATKLPYLESSATIITHIPTTPARARERGFDQSKVMARRMAKKAGLHTAPLLRRMTKSHQVGASKADRHKHMINAFTAINPYLIKGKTIVIVDDVMTTGATVESAAKVLKKAGAMRVLVAVFARAEQL